MLAIILAHLLRLLAGRQVAKSSKYTDISLVFDAPHMHQANHMNNMG